MENGAWPSGKATGFGPAIRRFESFRPRVYLFMMYIIFEYRLYLIIERDPPPFFVFGTGKGFIMEIVHDGTRVSSFLGSKYLKLKKLEKVHKYISFIKIERI